MKQYCVTPAYTDNYHVVECVDGKITDDTIVSYYELPGVTAYLESKGYKKAYYVPAAEIALAKAKRAYEDALEFYHDAQANALQITPAEAAKCRCLGPEEADELPFIEGEY